MNAVVSYSLSLWYCRQGFQRCTYKSLHLMECEISWLASSKQLKLWCLIDKHKLWNYRLWFLYKCMIDWLFMACLEKLNYFVRHYCKRFCLLIGRQTARISCQEYFFEFCCYRNFFSLVKCAHNWECYFFRC